MVKRLANPTLDISSIVDGSFVEFKGEYDALDYGVVVRVKWPNAGDQNYRVLIAAFPNGRRRIIERNVDLGEVRSVSERLGMRALVGKREGLYELAHDLGGHQGIVVLRACYELKMYIKTLRLRGFVKPVEAVMSEPSGPCTGYYIIDGDFRKGFQFLEGKHRIEPRVSEEGAMAYFNRDLDTWSRAFKMTQRPSSFLVYEVPHEGMEFVNTKLKISYMG